MLLGSLTYWRLVAVLRVLVLWAEAEVQVGITTQQACIFLLRLTL